MHLLLLAASLVCLLPSCAAMDFYVTPTHPPNQTCPGQPCYSLNQYAQSLTLFEDQRNISLLLLSGNHTLTHVLNITGIDDLMISKSVHSRIVDDDRVVIVLEAGIYVSSVSTLGVYNINMISKDGQCFHLTDVQSITQYQVKMMNIDIWTISDRIRTQSTIIINCSSNGRGLRFTYSGAIDQAVVKVQATNISEPEISNKTGLSFDCPFLVQNRLSLTLDVQDGNIERWSSGIEIDCQAQNVIVSRLIIQSTCIIGNLNGVIIFPTVKYLVTENTYLLDNQQTGMAISGWAINFMVRNTHFENNGIKGAIEYGGLILQCSMNNLTIQDTTFSDNQAFGVLIIENLAFNGIIKNSYFRGSQFGITFQDYYLLNIQLKDNSFTQNNFGIVFLLKENANVSSANSILCQNCTIAYNTIGIALNNIQDKPVMKNSKFHNNQGTPILAYQSKFELSGETSFENNTANRGGGLCMIYSTVQFANNSNITFRNNSAKEIGGAIYVVSRRYAAQTAFPYLAIIAEQRHIPLIDQIPCYYQFNVSNVEDFETLQIQINFINNTAMFGGNQIYGAPLDKTDVK